MKLKKMLSLLGSTYETYIMIDSDEMETIYTLINVYEMYKNYTVVNIRPHSSKGRNGILLVLSRE